MGWRVKFVFLLIVYFAGFATAIYCLAPAPEGESGTPGGSGTRSLIAKAINSQEFAQSVNSGMHKAIDFSKEAISKATEMIQEQIEQAQSEAKSEDKR